MVSELTVADIRECVRQLRSAEIKPNAGGMFYLPISEEAATLWFVAKHFPSWLDYV